MSKSCTVSASKEPAVNLDHNYREFGNRPWPSHIDKERTPWNVEYAHLNLGEVYDELFSEAIKIHDAAQTRNDRKLGSTSAYLDKVTRSKQQSPVYEHILQFGDMFSHGWTGKNTPSWEEASKMLDEVAEKIKDRYPQLKTVCLVKHLDEATPHLHWSYVPYATNYGKGMPVRVGLDKAMQQMGYKANSHYKTPSEMWLDDVRYVLVSIAKEHGYSIESPVGKTQHQRIQEFKRDIAHIDERIKALPEPDLTQVHKVPLQKDKVIIPISELEKLKEKATLVDYRNSLVEAIMREIRDLKERAANYVRRCRENLSKLAKRLDFVSEKSVKNLEDRADRAENRVIALESELAQKEETITELKKDKEELTKQAGDAFKDGIVAERDTWIDIVKELGLHKKKEFRDYVNERVGEDIIDPPSQGWHLDR
ncbi:MAG: plasmid recombination protein [Saccharofermentans sp.]|nr:plasmid recombination protein [Saccharofermentans sp.]